MEFVPTPTADPSAEKLFHGSTLVVPAVSYGNVGQLTLDLTVNTLLEHGQALGSGIEKVGRLFSKNVPPIAGSAAFSAQSPSELCLNLEVYHVGTSNVTIVQQRTAAIPGRTRAYVSELVAWAKETGFQSLCVLAGTDNMLRHDPMMQSRPVQTIYSQEESTALRNSAFLEQLLRPSEGSGVAEESGTNPATSSLWDSLRGTGMGPLLQKTCREAQLPFVAFVLACAEGDNVPDAMQMTAHLFAYLQLAANATPQPEPVGFAFPPSWKQLFGRGPDVSLFL